MTGDRVGAERQQAVSKLALAIVADVVIVGGKTDDSKRIAQAVLDSGVVVPKAELDEAFEQNAENVDDLSRVAAEQEQCAAAAERAREEAERERDEWKQRSLDYHRALSEGYGVEDGGVWEDRAAAAESENAELREAAEQAVRRLEREPLLSSMLQRETLLTEARDGLRAALARESSPTETD